MVYANKTKNKTPLRELVPIIANSFDLAAFIASSFEFDLLFLDTSPCHQHFLLVSQIHQLLALPQLLFVTYFFPIFLLLKTISEAITGTLPLSVEHLYYLRDVMPH